jgi:hypothetical protein
MLPMLPCHLKILNDVTPCTPLDALKFNLNHEMVHLFHLKWRGSYSGRKEAKALHYTREKKTIFNSFQRDHNKTCSLESDACMINDQQSCIRVGNNHGSPNLANHSANITTDNVTEGN